MLKEKWDALSPQKQKTLQIAAGFLIAAASVFFLFDPIPQGEGFFNLSSIIAFLLVLFVPRVLETQTGSPLPLLRKVMLITLVIGILLLILDVTVFKIFAK